MSLLRAALAAIVVLVMGTAILGIGMGEAPAQRQSAPTAAQVAAAEQRIAAGGATIRAGRQAFTEDGCDRCHSIAASGADGQLGPRLDALDEDADDIAESITDPRDDIADGFPQELMPTDYAQGLGIQRIRSLAAFIAAASGEEDEDDEQSGKGRGRSGRG